MLKAKVDLNLLVSLNALLKQKNVTNAAKQLSVSQSSASAALARLREIYQDPLLVRVGRGYELTPLSQQLVQPVQDAISDLDGIFSRRDQLNLSSETYTFRIAARGYVTSLLLPPLIKKLKLIAPNIKLRFSRFDSGSLAQLTDGVVDFVVMSDQFEHNFPSEVLYKEGWSCIVCQNNSQLPQRLTEDAYLKMDHLVFLPGPGRRVSPTVIVTETGSKRRAVAAVDDFSLIPQMIKGTDLIATVPNKMAKLMKDDLGLRLIKPPHQMPELTQTLCWNPRHSHNPLYLWMIKRIVEVALAVSRH